MTHITTSGRALAMVAGAAFTYGGLRIILGDTLTDPTQWTTSTQLTVLTVLGTIAAGHLFNDAKRARHWLACFGFGLLFLAGTGLVVFNSVGRQAETSMLTASQSDAAAERRVAIKGALARAEKMLSEAQADLARECKTGKGKRCEGIQATIGVYEAAVKGHVADLEKLGPQKPVNAKASEGAKIAALFGANEAQAKAALMLLEPFLWTMFFEIGSIVSLGFAFRHTPRAMNDNTPKAITEGETFTDADLEKFKEVVLPPANAIPFQPVGSEVVAWAEAFEAKHGRAPRLDEAQAAFPEHSRSTVYRRLKQAA